MYLNQEEKEPFVPKQVEKELFVSKQGEKELFVAKPSGKGTLALAEMHFLITVWEQF